MNAHVWFLVFVPLVCYNFVYARSGAWLKRFENCDPNAKYDAVINFTFKTIDRTQYTDGTFILKSPFDNTLRFNATIDMLTGKNYVYLFSIQDRKACDGMHKYFGEFIYNMERQGRLIAGMCPIPEGGYQWHNFRVDFERVTTLAYFPFGNLRITNFLYKKNNDVYTCFMLEFEHRML